MASKLMQKISSHLPLVHRHSCLIFVSQIKYNGAILAGTILENVSYDPHTKAGVVGTRVN